MLSSVLVRERQKEVSGHIGVKGYEEQTRCGHKPRDTWSHWKLG